MLEILPSINRSTWQEVESDIKKIENHSDWVELDVCDGTLSKTKTWTNPEDLKKLELSHPLRFAVHLMVKNPEKYVRTWIDAKVRRIIIQFEGVKSGFFGSQRKKIIKSLSELCRENWVEFGISVSPKTGVEKIGPFLDLIDLVQVLAVPIGLSNQGLDRSLFFKMSALSDLKQDKNFKTEWDGGVELETVDQIKKSGADIIVSTSFVFGAADPGRALEVLKKTAIGI